MASENPQQNVAAQTTVPLPYEQWLSQYAYKAPSERTFIDKLLSRKEVFELQQLIQKEDLTRSELLKLLYMLTATELKLANLGEYDRYLLGKYFTWVRDLVKVAEFLYDYESQVESFDGFTDEGKKEIKETLDAIKKMMLHDVKFSVDIFLFLIRSSLGLTALGFDTLSKARYEYEYGSGYPGVVQPTATPQSSRWNPFKR